MGVKGEDYHYTALIQLQRISGALRGARSSPGGSLVVQLGPQASHAGGNRATRKQPMAVMFAVDTFIARGPFRSMGQLAIINVLPVSVVRMGKISDNAP